MNIPPGNRFRPTDQEMISYYLLRRVMGLPLPFPVILERNLYGENTAPWDVFRDIDEYHSCYWHSKDHETKGVIKKTIYVFTKLVKASSKSNRMARRAGSGTWSGQTGATMIKNRKGEIIGSRKMLSFQDLNAKKGEYHWIMHEYSLDGVYKNILENNYNVNNDLVLCKITRCFRGKPTTDHIESNGGIDQVLNPTTVENIDTLIMENNECSINHKRSSDSEGLNGCDAKRARISSPSPLDEVLADLENFMNKEDMVLPIGVDFEKYKQSLAECLHPNDLNNIS